MEYSEASVGPADPLEDETTVPTGPWEEDENEDCPAYHTAAFRMYVMKVGRGALCSQISRYVM